MHKIELLSPVGSLANLKAAIAGGADAVYLGLNKFNAREYATNFNKNYFKEAVKLCKSNNVKLFLTANTLIKNSEIKEFLEQIKYAYEQGADSVIIQDPSFIEIIKKNFPKLKIHISTQAGVMNSYHANLFSEADSINLARELSKENIKLIREKYKKELEIFIHGALCVCISGSCLFSSFVGGRSGNRGKCAQPCRKLYNQKYLLSTKELCLINKIPEIIKLGINRLKIEGRMRTPFYVNTVTSVYRRAIDSFYSGRFSVSKQDMGELENAFSREFTEGKYAGENVFNSNKASGTSNINEKFYEVKSNPIKIEKRKANNHSPEIKEKESSGKKLIVRVYNEEDALKVENYADIICLDMFNKDFEKIKSKINKPLYAVTPRIMFDTDLKKIEERIKEISPVGILAGNLGILNMNINLPIILDHNSNCFNDLQMQYYENLKAKPIISPELSIAEMEKFKNKDFLVLIHGKIRLMTLAHNLRETIIKDEKGFNFKVNKIFNGSEILNEKEFGLFNKVRSLLKSGINQFYIDSETNQNDLREILSIYRQIIDGKTPETAKLQREYVLGWSREGVL